MNPSKHIRTTKVRSTLDRPINYFIESSSDFIIQSTTLFAKRVEHAQFISVELKTVPSKIWQRSVLLTNTFATAAAAILEWKKWGGHCGAKEN